MKNTNISKTKRLTKPKQRGIIERYKLQRSLAKNEFDNIEYMYKNGLISIRELEKSKNRKKEKLYKEVQEYEDALKAFYPERMAERILDMGDIMSIAEKVEGIISEDEAIKQAKRMQSGKFDLEDFLQTFKQIKKLGPLENIIKLLPQARKMGLNNIQIDPKQMAHVEAIILSMTPYERRHPDVLKASRKQRIAKGSGRSVEEVNRLLKQFEEMKKMMKMMQNGNMKMPF